MLKFLSFQKLKYFLLVFPILFVLFLLFKVKIQIHPSPNQPPREPIIIKNTHSTETSTDHQILVTLDKSNWSYRKPIIINNTHSTNDLTDYQVLVTLDTASLISAGKMRSDCKDIRFTDSDGSTQLNYWLESGCNTTSTKIWVKVPSILASATKTIYVYYGNPKATLVSNGEKTFLAFNLKFNGVLGAGYRHTCALLSNGTVKCWGWNRYGQLGDGTTTTRSTPVSVSGLTNAVAISAGYRHTCALLSNGTVKCWGWNRYGQLGDGTTTTRLTPVTVSGLTNAVAISAGGYHTCALLSDGTVKCWGRNPYGELLGDETVIDTSTPVTVSGLTNAVAISAGYDHTCVLLSDGTVKYWGFNDVGRLRDGTTITRSTLVTVSGLTNAVAITAEGVRACALLSNGTVKCWNWTPYGEILEVLEDETVIDPSTPVTVSGLTNVVAIAAGDYHACALLSNGTVKCWGGNYHGQLGDGTANDSPSPVTVSGLTNVVAITAGDDHTCALLSNGTIKCWGENYYGQLGNGTDTNTSTPVSVLNYNLGGRYDKTGGIPATIQKAPYFVDTYFVRKYASPEPTTSVGEEETLSQ